ncbi:uncharacterized protein [Ranitomeya imitator]|uniref:uncharacterized protein n=1 Tax=Ranitomeya imitator TaxID=111125 RepID=UPI0037E94C91
MDPCNTWQEECLPTFQEISLQSSEHPTDNKSYTMYHGTTYHATKKIIRNGFMASPDGMLGPGVYVTRDIYKAMKYPLNNDLRKVVLMLTVNVGKVKKIDRHGHPLQKTWHQQGYNTAWVPPLCGMNTSGQEEDCIYNPQRIKVVDVYGNPNDVCKLKPEEPEDGRIYVMYHGTTLSAAKAIITYGFQQSTDGMLGRGVYLTRDRKKALRYPIGDKSQQVVLKLRVNVGRVIMIDRQNHPCQKIWHSYSYDTAWVPPNCGMVASGLEEDCIWDPRRIKVVGVEVAPRLFFMLCQNNSWYLLVIMAHHSGYSPNYTEDYWREEALPGFHEVILRSSDLPQDGKVYVMYHGTTFSAAQEIIGNGFRQSDDGMLGRGVYVSRDKNKALRYPIRDKTDQVVLKLSINVGKVKKIDYQGHSMQKTWNDHGYDTAWVPAYCGMVDSGLEEDCIWDPKRIKVVGIAEASSLHLECLNMINDIPKHGKIYVMFHGTTLQAALEIIKHGFKRSSDGMLGAGVYVSRDQEKAAQYPLENRWNQVILRLRVNVGKVKMIDHQGHPLQKTWRSKGYHTAWVPEYCGMVNSGLEEDCIWDPKRIKVVGIARSPPFSVHKYMQRFLSMYTDDDDDDDE